MYFEVTAFDVLFCKLFGSSWYFMAYCIILRSYFLDVVLSPLCDMMLLGGVLISEVKG